jgi:hypothetical protein
LRTLPDRAASALSVSRLPSGADSTVWTGMRVTVVLSGAGTKWSGEDNAASPSLLPGWVTWVTLRVFHGFLIVVPPELQ